MKNNTVINDVFSSSLCLCSAQTNEVTESKDLHNREIQFLLFDWNKPYKDIKLFEKWVANLKDNGFTHIEISAPLKTLEPQRKQYDFSFFRKRLEVIQQYGMGIRVRVNSYYAGCLPEWYKGYMWQDYDGNESKQYAPPSINDERFCQPYYEFCTALSAELKDFDGISYQAFIGIHGEYKWGSWYSYDPATMEYWQKCIQKPRPKWLNRVVGDFDLDDMKIPARIINEDNLNESSEEITDVTFAYSTVSEVLKGA